MIWDCEYCREEFQAKADRLSGILAIASMGGRQLNKPIVGMAADQTSGGY